jgi:hypothetical protein
MDSPFQWLAWVLILVGAAIGGLGLRDLARARAGGEAFVPDRAGE